MKEKKKSGIRYRSGRTTDWPFNLSIYRIKVVTGNRRSGRKKEMKKIKDRQTIDTNTRFV